MRITNSSFRYGTSCFSDVTAYPKGRKANVEAHAKSKGLSVNGLINALLREDMKLTEDEWKSATEE